MEVILGDYSVYITEKYTYIREWKVCQDNQAFLC